MFRKTVAILGWTGRGRLEDLESSAEFVLREREVKGHVSRIGTSMTVEGPEPLGVAALLGDMPGVAWVAAGGAGRSAVQLSAISEVLAKKYLRKGDRFAVEAEGGGDVLAPDIGGSITSRIIESVKGSRVSAESPKVRFRVAFDGTKGVIGVEVKKGPGGLPTGRESAVCLVSGGKHSSVVAWHAVLTGFRVRLVHARSGDESLRAVAGLYSELSHRVDPRWLRLEVLEGDSILRALSAYAGRSKDPVFGGFCLSSGRRLHELPGALAPLYLMPEERFKAEFDALGIKSCESRENWNSEGGAVPTVRAFGGRIADVNDVLDGLEQPN